jgi:hypothetical protein
MARNAGASQGEPDVATAEGRIPDVMIKASTEIIEALTAARNYVSASLLNLQGGSPDLTRERDAIEKAMVQIDRCTEAAHLIRDLAQSAARRVQRSNSDPK